jgi:hypothetical protein
MFSVKFLTVKSLVDNSDLQGVEALDAIRRLGLPEEKFTGRVRLGSGNCWTTISGLDHNECRKFEEFSRTDVPKILIPVCLLEKGEADFDHGQGDAHYQAGNLYLRVRDDMSPSRAIQLLMKLKIAKEQEVLATIQKQVEDLRKEAEEIPLRTEVRRLTNVIREAVKEISESRQFVRSKKLAALRARLEAALPAEQDDTDDYTDYDDQH